MSDIEQPGKMPSLPVVGGPDKSSGMYETIAKVHRQMTEAKWRARTAGVEMRINPMLLVYCDEAIAFLAEELLKLRLEVEKRETKPCTVEPSSTE